MDGKETVNALELRALAAKLAKASGKWTETDMPGRNILVFEDRGLQIAYREPWAKHNIAHHALDIFVLGRNTQDHQSEGAQCMHVNFYHRAVLGYLSVMRSPVALPPQR